MVYAMFQPLALEAYEPKNYIFGEQILTTIKQMRIFLSQKSNKHCANLPKKCLILQNCFSPQLDNIFTSVTFGKRCISKKRGHFTPLMGGREKTNGREGREGEASNCWKDIGG